MPNGKNKNLDLFFKALKRKPSDLVFNPWFESDDENDLDPTAPQTRLDNLKSYMAERSNAEYLLLAEALGYQGGHFSGIPMTSERIILGDVAHKGITPAHVCQTRLQRTSNTNKHANRDRDGYGHQHRHRDTNGHTD